MIETRVPLREPVRAPVARIATAWLLGVLGVPWAWVLGLASAMKTVPSMSFAELAWTLPIPLLTLAVAWTVAAAVHRGAAPRWSAWAVAPAVALAGLALFIGAASYVFQP